MKLQLVRLPAAVLGALISCGAGAVNTDIGGVSISSNNRFTLGGAWRVEQPQDQIIGLSNGGTAKSTNGDDSDLAFHRGLVAAAAKMTSDLGVSYGNFGLFARGSYLFDQDLHSHDYFNPANYGAGKAASMAEFSQRTEAVRKHNGNDADLLDAYLYGSVQVADRTVTAKAGRTIINWGESTLVLNGINSYLTADANQFRVPGFELDEVIIPYEQVVLSSNLVGRLNFEGFYQLKWYHTEPDAVGSYFSSDDRAGIAATRGNLDFGQAPENTPNTTIPRIADREPRNGGQFGVKLDYTFEELNSLDVALYAMQYHSRLPLFSEISKPTFAAPSETAAYFQEYPENIKLYGVSFNTSLPFGGIAMQGEWSLKKDQPLQIDDVELAMTALGAPSQLDNYTLGSSLGGKYIRGWRRFNVQQYDVNFTKIFSPSPVYDQLLALVEFAAVDANLPSNSTLRFESPGTYTPGDCVREALACQNSASPAPFNQPVTQNQNPYASPFSWGYRVLLRADYNNVFGTQFGLQPTVLFFHDVKGTTPTPLLNFIENRKEAGLAMGIKFTQEIGGELGYYAFFGGGDRNLIADRDMVQAILKYQF